MNEKSNGGPASPFVGTHEQVLEVGMTLREYLAAHAPVTWQDAIESLDCTDEQVGPWRGSQILERLVLLRTDYADAMVAALHGEGGKNEPA